MTATSVGELVVPGLAPAHLLQVSGTIAQRGASWLQRARTGGLVRLDLTQPKQLALLGRYGPFASTPECWRTATRTQLSRSATASATFPASPTGWTKPSSNVSEPFSQRPA